MKLYKRDFEFDMPQWNGQMFLVVTPQELNQLMINNCTLDDFQVIPAAETPQNIGRYVSAGYGIELWGEGWVEVPIAGIGIRNNSGEWVGLVEYPEHEVLYPAPPIGKTAVWSNSQYYNHGCMNSADVIHIGRNQWRVLSVQSCHSCHQVGHDYEYEFARVGDVVNLHPYDLID